MATQNNVVNYGKAIQYQLAGIVSPIPVYSAFNRNFATQPKFITWMLRNVHQPVYTGQIQSNKGIDRPVFQISIFTQKIEDGFTIDDQSDIFRFSATNDATASKTVQLSTVLGEFLSSKMIFKSPITSSRPL